MQYRLGYMEYAPNHVDIHLDREVTSSDEKLSFQRMSKSKTEVPLCVADLLRIPGVIGVFINTPYTIQLWRGATFKWGPILSQAIMIIHMHFGPFEKLEELDPVYTQRGGKGSYCGGVSEKDLHKTPPLFDEDVSQAFSGEGGDEYGA